MKKGIILLLFLSLFCLRSFSQNAERLYSSVSPATVYLRHEVLMDPNLCRNPGLVKKWEAERKMHLLSTYYALSCGSGFLVDDDGLILTNRHVADIGDLAEARGNALNSLVYSVEQYASSAFSNEDKRLLKLDLYAMLTKGAYRFSATVGSQVVTEVAKIAVARQDEPDVALLKLPSGYGQGLTLASPDALASMVVGQEVFSFGFPLEPSFNELIVTMNKGTISALRKTDLGIQHSASISPGNSGGPLVDSFGTVLGMNTAYSKDGNNLFFAIGADKIRDFLAKRGVSVAMSRPGTALKDTARGSGTISVMIALRPAVEGVNSAEPNGVEGMRVSSQVSVQGEKGAEVALDGQKVGVSPLLLVVNKPSTTISVRGPGGVFLAKLRLDPSLRGATVLQAELQKAGDLALSSNESQVRVYLDGADLGAFSSGLLRALPAGNHILELVGQNSYCSQEVTIGEKATAQAKAELRPVGRLDIKVPADFQTTVKGGSYSTTISGNASLANIPVGDYDIQTASGDGPVFTTSFSLQKGAQATWEPCTLGFVSLAVHPAGSQCFLGATRAFLADDAAEAMAPGTYNAVIKHAGYRDQQVSFTVFAGKRTQVAANLVEFGRGAISLPRFGAPVILKVNDEIKVGADRPDGSVLYAGIPSGIPLAVLFSSAVAESTALPDAKLSLSEGETRALELPSGRFSLPWLPEGAKVEIGTSQKVELRSAGGEGFLSLPLPPGEYRVSITGGPMGTDYSTTVKIADGATCEPENYLGAMLAKLRDERSSESKSLSSYRARKARRITGLTVGIAGSIASGAFFILGVRAKNEYDRAELSADAVSSWEKVATYRRWNLISFAASAIGFILAPKQPYDRDGGEALRRSIAGLDESLRVLGGIER